MGALALLADARSAGLNVAADGGLLVIRGPRRAEAIALRLLDHKAELLSILGDGWREELELASDAFRELWSERAAIMEFDGNLPRDEAERKAFHLVTEALHRPVSEDFIVGALDAEPFDPELFDLMEGKPFS